MNSGASFLKLSSEELAQIKTDSWENPVFSNMDQLMDERLEHTCFGTYMFDTCMLHNQVTTIMSNQSSKSHFPSGSTF